MLTTESSMFQLTASDLMSRQLVTLTQGMPLRDAARRLAQARIHGAPVVDFDGRCVGVLSVSDLARWGVRQADPPPPIPRTCSYQEPFRERDGRESVLCTLPEGKCHYQVPRQLPDGRTVMVCAEPHCVCLEWQMVEVESLPAEDVRNYMTADPVTVGADAPIADIARRMVDAAVHRVVVVDDESRPLGIVSSTDLVAALAREGQRS